MSQSPMVRGVPQQPANPLDTRIFETDDAGLLNTQYAIAVGQSFGGTLSGPLDTDYVGVTLAANTGYAITLTLPDTANDGSVTLLDATGTQSYSSSTTNRLGDVVFRLHTEEAGQYFMSPGAFGQTDYVIAVEEIGFRPWSTSAIADYLISGYWQDRGEPVAAWRAEDATQLRVDLTALSQPAQDSARLAMQTWSDYANIAFNETNQDPQIIFTDTESGGFAMLDSDGDELTVVDVNVSDSFVRQDLDLGGEAYGIYLHEIGHALGLGHAGDYNRTAQYHLDALYSNDTLLTSIMSYFDVTDRPFGQELDVLPLTPMPADIIAIQQVYGEVTANLGDTVYGSSGNAEGTLGLYLRNTAPDATPLPHTTPAPAMFTILDSGGIDTIDLTWARGATLSDLRASALSTSGADGIAFVIAEGTVIENLRGNVGDDAVIGNAANNWIRGMGGNDTLIGLEGDDALQGGDGDDSLRGEAGNDTLDGGTGSDMLTGGLGNNAIFAGSGDDFAIAGAGRDTIWASAGDDTVWAGAGDDLVGGGTGQDNLSTGTGNDTVWASTGNDTIFAGAGNDEVAGGTGSDALWAGAGDDTVFASAGNDALSGAEGNDSLWAGSGNDEAFGAAGNDWINGGAGADTLWGGDGEDTLLGSDGEDSLTGLSGDDVLSGGRDNDTLTGGDGTDVFVFTAGQDHITDFRQSDDDQIDLRSWGTDWDSLSTSGALETDGTGTRIVLAADAELTLANLTPDTLQASDFIFS